MLYSNSNKPTRAATRFANRGLTVSPKETLYGLKHMLHIYSSVKRPPPPKLRQRRQTKNNPAEEKRNRASGRNRGEKSTGSMEGFNNLKELVDEELVLKTSKVAGIGLAAGSVWGALVSMLRDGPQVGSNVKYPELVRTGKVCGHYAGHLAVLGATYVGVEQALEKYRMKKDYINGAVAGFAAGATVMGFRARSFPTAIASGSVLALTSVLLDVTGMRTAEEKEKVHH